jgi:hypothetical protein
MDKEGYYKVSWIDPVFREEKYDSFTELGEAMLCMSKVRKEGGEPNLQRCKYMKND